MILKNKRGFSLIEVMVALAILGVATKVFLTLTQNTTKQEMKLYDSMAVRSGIDSIRAVLSNPKSCDAILLKEENSAFHNVEMRKRTTIKQIVDEAGEVTHYVGEKLDKVTIKEFSYQATETFSKLSHGDEVFGRVKFNVLFETRLRPIEKHFTINIYASWVNEEQKWKVDKCKTVESDILNAAKIANCQSMKITMMNGEKLVSGWDNFSDSCLVQPATGDVVKSIKHIVPIGTSGDAYCAQLGLICTSARYVSGKNLTCAWKTQGEVAEVWCQGKLLDLSEADSGNLVCDSIDKLCRFAWDQGDNPVSCFQHMSKETAPGKVFCY